MLRGTSGGKEREDVYKIDVLHSVISPFEEYERYISLAKDKDLKIIVSNTTEAGIYFNAADKFEDFAASIYPAKLTKFLYERYSAGLNGVYLLPVELIDNNADALKDCVSKYIKLWKLPDEFAKWNDTENYYCNALVDRIVSGYPKDEATREHLYELIGEKDELVSIGELFGLWAVENKGEISEYQSGQAQYRSRAYERYKILQEEKSKGIKRKSYVYRPRRVVARDKHGVRLHAGFAPESVFKRNACE